MSTLEKDKRPSMQWYPGDWMKDADLCGVSTTARGALMDVLCLMFECEERGVLSSNGSAWTIERLAQAIRGDYELNITAIRELCSAGVLRRRSDGALFSKRMVRDESIRKEKARAGRIGGQAKRKQTPSKTEAKGVAKRGSSSSSSSSASSSSLTAKKSPPPTPPGGSDHDVIWAEACEAMNGDQFKTTEFRKEWIEVILDRRRNRRPKWKPTNLQKQMKALEDVGYESAIASLKLTHRNSYAGLAVQGGPRPHGQAGRPPKKRDDQLEFTRPPGDAPSF